MGLAISLIYLARMVILALLFLYVIILWVTQNDWGHPIAVGIGRVVRPFLAPFRPLLPGTAIDISPLLAMFTIIAVTELLIRILQALQPPALPF